MKGGDDIHLDVLQNIEAGLKLEYENNPDLTDKTTIRGLENAKVAVKQEYGFGKSEKLVIDDDTRGMIKWCVYIGKERINKINNLTLKEYLSKIDKVKRSVQRHSEYGKRAYYEFIKDFV